VVKPILLLCGKILLLLCCKNPKFFGFVLLPLQRRSGKMTRLYKQAPTQSSPFLQARHVRTRVAASGHAVPCPRLLELCRALHCACMLHALLVRCSVSVLSLLVLNCISSAGTLSLHVSRQSVIQARTEVSRVPIRHSSTDRSEPSAKRQSVIQALTEVSRVPSANPSFKH
jgi:hypothetical protein